MCLGGIICPLVPSAMRRATSKKPQVPQWEMHAADLSPAYRQKLSYTNSPADLEVRIITVCYCKTTEIWGCLLCHQNLAKTVFEHFQQHF